MSKPKEFWLQNIEDENVCFAEFSDNGGLHVIEKSAYDKAISVLHHISEQTDMGGVVLEESAFLAIVSLKELGESND